MNKLFIMLWLLGCCLVILVANAESSTVFINGSSRIGRTDSDFVCATLDWWPPEKCDYGTCSWGSASLLNLDLSNPVLLNAVKGKQSFLPSFSSEFMNKVITEEALIQFPAFSPLKIRLGGTLQDKVTYETRGQPCHPTFRNASSELFGFSAGCLPMSRWDELNTFFRKSGAAIVFGLNALNGKTIASNGSAEGAWNSSNAEALIRYTVNRGFTVLGWELGNELSGSGIGTSVAADQYASDVANLHSIVQKVYAGFRKNKPLVIAPGGFYDANWLTEFVKRTPRSSIDVVSHHIYNLGPGVDTHLIEKILDPSYLDGGSSPFEGLRGILDNSGSRAVAWVGEAGGAYNSGRNLVTNAFVFSFWYLDQLGMASSYDTKTYCRQSLIGGNYGLLDTTTFVPNPDYYSALLWHRLMGRNVLSARFSGTKKIRAYAHCSKRSQGITLLLINLDGNTTANVHVSSEDAITVRTVRHHRNRKTKFAKMGRGSKVEANLREEYHLTAYGGDIHSRTVLLNGKVLAVNTSGSIPPLEPIQARVSDPITIAPFSIVFAHIASMHVPACK
ncbi:Heparanase-like protein 3 [Linum perenne]